MIPIYIGISHRFDAIKDMTANSILANTSAPVDIRLLYPKIEQGCTGFTNVRYEIRKGIYLDVDMIVLGDIAELWEYRQKGKFVCMHNGSTAVSVIDCEHNCQNKREENLLPKVNAIPEQWNIEDYRYIGNMPEDTKLLHFTNMHTQPWFNNHPDPKMVELYERYKSST